MKKYSVILLFTACMFLSCRQPTPTMYDTAPFRHVNITGLSRTDVYLSPSETFAIGVKGPAPDSVRISTRNDSLFIKTPKSKHARYSVYIYAPEFASVSGSFLHCLCSTDTIRQDSISITAIMVKKAQLILDVNRLAIPVIHGNRFTLSGRAAEAVINASYAHDLAIDASDLEAEDVYLSACESYIRLNVSNHLWLHDIFDSQIIYTGTPQIMECNMKWSIIKNPLFYYWKTKLFERL